MAMCMWMAQAAVTVYHSSSPLIFDPAGAAWYNEVIGVNNSIRVTNNKDLVPRILPFKNIISYDTGCVPSQLSWHASTLYASRLICTHGFLPTRGIYTQPSLASLAIHTCGCIVPVLRMESLCLQCLCMSKELSMHGACASMQPTTNLIAWCMAQWQNTARPAQWAANACLQA